MLTCLFQLQNTFLPLLSLVHTGGAAWLSGSGATWQCPSLQPRFAQPPPGSPGSSGEVWGALGFWKASRCPCSAR